MKKRDALVTRGGSICEKIPIRTEVKERAIARIAENDGVCPHADV